MFAAVKISGMIDVLMFFVWLLVFAVVNDVEKPKDDRRGVCPSVKVPHMGQKQECDQECHSPLSLAIFDPFLTA